MTSDSAEITKLIAFQPPKGRCAESHPWQVFPEHPQQHSAQKVPVLKSRLDHKLNNTLIRVFNREIRKFLDKSS